MRRITVTGSTIYSDAILKQLCKKYLGRMLNLADLRKLAESITLRYQRDGYILSRAIIPAQRIKNGALKIQVIEGYIKNIKIKGKVSHATAKLIREYATVIQCARPVCLKVLERYLLLTNDLTGIVMKAVLSPAKAGVGAALLTMVVTQRHIDGSLQYDNFGTRYLGPHQLSANMQLHSVFNAADNLSLFMVRTTPENDVDFVGVQYERPISWDGLLLTASANRTRTHPAFLLEPLNLAGESEAWSVGLQYPLIRSRSKNLYLSLYFQALNSDTKFADHFLYRDKIRALNFSAAYDFADKWRGINKAKFTVSKGLPVLNASKKNSAIPQSRSDGKSNYLKFMAELSRLQVFNQQFSGLLAFTGQYSKDALLSAEEFGFGGRTWGRGFDPSELIGDSGIAAKAELMCNTHPDFKLLRFVQYYIFYDAGVVWNKGGGGSFQRRRVTASSAGMGMRMRFTPHLSGLLEVAKPLVNKVEAEEQAGHNGKAPRGFFSIAANV